MKAELWLVGYKENPKAKGDGDAEFIPGHDIVWIHTQTKELKSVIEVAEDFQGVVIDVKDIPKGVTKIAAWTHP